MKHIVTILLAGSIGAYSMAVIAELKNQSHLQEYGYAVSQDIFSQENVIKGEIVETKKGVAIASAEGTLLLKGINAQGLVGKMVHAAGVIRGESFFAVKIML